jgi:hypothetical protein
MKTETDEESERAPEIFAAVFSRKKAVALKRLTILRSINRCSSGKMGFRDILKEVQRIRDDLGEYSSQQLAYDLRVLKDGRLLDQAKDREYSITTYGYYLLEVYDSISYKLGEKKTQKPAIAGQTIGQIEANGFDHNKLGDELSKLAFFRKKLSFEPTKCLLEWKDDSDSFRSEIDISADGSFAARVWLYITFPPARKGFIEDISGSDELYQMTRGVQYAIAYFIKRVAERLWNNAKVTLLQKPDAYPINIFGENNFGQTPA